MNSTCRVSVLSKILGYLRNKGYANHHQSPRSSTFATCCITVLFAAACISVLYLPTDGFSISSTGVIVPLYSYPGTTWDKLVQEKKMHESVPIVAIINPDNGPGTKDQNYVVGVHKLQSAGITVLGYVYSQHVDATEIRNDIGEYKNWYGVDGIFFDAMSNVPGNETFYKQLSEFAKSMGLQYTVGNPGADTAPSYVGTVDNIVIHDNKGVPPTALLGGWHDGYAKSNFSSISYGVDDINRTYVSNATKHVQYIYITDLNLPNPFYNLPSYVDKLMDMIETAQQNNKTVSVTVKATSGDNLPLNGFWTVVKSGTNTTSGFTPFTFSATEGQRYEVTVSDYGNYTFSHWDDNETGNTRTVLPSSNMTLTAYYGHGNVTENQTSTPMLQGNLTAAPIAINGTVKPGASLENQTSPPPTALQPVSAEIQPTEKPNNTGSVTVTILYTGGDRADYSLLSFKVYQDASNTVYRQIDSVSSNPFEIDGLPLNHRYKVEVFANGMCSDIEYVSLEKPTAQLALYLSPPGGMRLHIFYNDGYTAVPNAFVVVKSQDNKTWASSSTDAYGETLRFWLEPTVMKNNYFMIDVNVGKHLSYSYSPVFLYPGYGQEINVVTPWPSKISSAIDVRVYDSSSKLFSTKDGSLLVEILDSGGNKVAQSQVTPRGDADFANLRVGDYVVRAINEQNGQTVGESVITLDGKAATFSLREAEPAQGNLTSHALAGQ